MGGGAGSPDFFYREAQRLGYVARSAFKLLQMQKQFNLIKPGASVLDLGCAPGAWLQVACQNLGPLSNGGAVVGIDVKKVKIPSVHCDDRVRTVCGDVMHIMKNQVKQLSYQGKGFSVILSDMCPPVSGIPVKDASLSMELGVQAFSLAVGQAAISADAEQPADGSESMMDFEGLLLCGGNLVVKLLENEDLQEFKQMCTPCFKKVSLLRPKATRASSREIYLICEGLR